MTNQATGGFLRCSLRVGAVLRLFGIVMAVAVVGPCASAQDWPKEMTFRSGRKVTILSVQQVETKSEPTGRVGSALILEYETKLKLVEDAALRKEIDEIWAWLKTDAEHRKLTEALILIEPKGGSAKSAEHLSFVFKKQSDGSWARVGGHSE